MLNVYLVYSNIILLKILFLNLWNFLKEINLWLRDITDITGFYYRYYGY